MNRHIDGGPDDHGREAREVIAKALRQWTHDCKRNGCGVLECGGCGAELNDFRDGAELAEDVRLTLSQNAYVVVSVASIVDASRRHADLESDLRNAHGAMRKAHGMLTPGMKAGTADARATLGAALRLNPSAPDLSGHAEPRRSPINPSPTV